MNVVLNRRWQEFVDQAVSEGRFASADKVVEEGLRLVAEREEKLEALRETLRRSIARGGSHNDEDVAAALDDEVKRLEAEGL